MRFEGLKIAHMTISLMRFSHKMPVQASSLTLPIEPLPDPKA